MTSIDEHKKKIQEHLSEIKNAIEEGIEKKPITIGFNCSACAIQLLELYLHITNKISIGKIIKHDWFKKPHPEQKIPSLTERKLPIDFPRKQEIYELIYTLEEERNILVYGKSDEKQIKKVLEIFLKIKNIFMEMFEYEKFKL
ncbi:hypothetical protein J4463_02145 [Candidatus Pacearchaeota archaeon]|nr:hypothetical protein [Candidatus Pacearchaeota archaeon]